MGNLLSSLTLKTANIDAAEEATITLASNIDPEHVTDSQSACHHYQMGRITAVALKI